MNCLDCGGPSDKGWTDGEEHDICASCDTARALGSPIPERKTNPPTYWQTYYQRKKLGLVGKKGRHART